MQRTLVQQGSTTLMVSLPAKWVQENKLKKGSTIDINRINQNLMISSFGNNYQLKIIIKLKGLTESLIRTYITNTYRKGFDNIKVFYETKEQLSILKEVIKTRLIGFEITKTEKSYCIVESVTEPSLDLFENILSKLIFNISQLLDLCLENSSFKRDTYEEIEENIQRYDNFCRRVISKGARLTGEKELYWTFLTLIVHGNREIYFLIKETKKTKYSPALLLLIKKVKEIIDLIKKSYLERRVDHFEELHFLEKEVRIEAKKIIFKGKEEAVFASLLLSASRRFYQANSPLLGLILQGED